jgi:hypothetical protein
MRERELSLLTAFGLVGAAPLVLEAKASPQVERFLLSNSNEAES